MAKKVKGQPLPLKLIYNHCLIMLNISCDYSGFGLISFQTTICSNKIPFKCTRKHLTLTLRMSKSTKDHHVNKRDRPHIPNATYQVPKSLAFWFSRKRILKGFYHIWAWRPSWSCDQDHLNKLLLPNPKESPYNIKQLKYIKILLTIITVEKIITIQGIFVSDGTTNL